jgi:hypothetical protein
LQNNSQWFQKFAVSVREIVVTHGGAIVMTIEELTEAVVQDDASFKDCPQAVLFHPTLPLRKWAQLDVCMFNPSDAPKLLDDPSSFMPSADILLIHFSTMTADVAYRHIEENGLSEAVNIRLLDAV